MRAWRRRSPPTPRGSPSSATIRCCCRARIRRRWRAPARPIRSPISRRWRRSSISTSTGTSSPIRARPGRSRCFPMMPEDVAVAKLADAIFAASRVDQDGAVAAWETHNAVLRERTDWLNGQRFHALQYSGPGTDLTIGLADGHEWEGGASTAKNGITCNANIPTEEVFTTPHCRRVERPCRQLQAAVLSGHADRRHRGAVRGRPHRRGQGLARRGGAEEGARHRRGRARVSAKWRWCRIPRRSRKAGCCSSTRCSTRTPPATSRSASAIRNASSTATS